MCLLNAKFFYVETKLTLVELGLARQYSGEDLDVYVRNFYEKALNCCHLVGEEVFVNVCLYGMMKECRIFFRESFSFFSKLMEAT